jgi:hypothetical protein
MIVPSCPEVETAPEQDWPVVTLKPVAEVQPAGIVTEPAQDKPVVELNPVDEVQPAGRVPTEAQDKPVVELNPVDEVQPAGYDPLTTPPELEVNIAFNFARVEAPTNPVPEVKPAGVKISDAYLFWKAITATLVNPPKVIDSIPAEPTPVAATLVLVSVFNKACKHLTSAPLEPRVKFFVKVIPVQAVTVALATPLAVEPVVPPNCPCNEAN